MASKQLQSHPIPDKFEEILHDLTREILRNQPLDILDFSHKYFSSIQNKEEFIQTGERREIRPADKQIQQEEEDKIHKQISHTPEENQSRPKSGLTDTSQLTTETTREAKRIVKSTFTDNVANQESDQDNDISIDSIEDLKEVLYRYNIDTTTWGTEKFKTIESLQSEITQKESLLYEHKGKLVRKVMVITIALINNGMLLIEEKQKMRDGRMRDRNKILAGKLAEGEGPLECASREIIEELGHGMTTDDFTLDGDSMKKSESIKDALSQPGLLANQTTYVIEGTISKFTGGESFETVEIYPDQAESIHYWGWVSAEEKDKYLF